MKRMLQKPIALFLAMIMAFGAMPFAGIAWMASADSPILESVAIVPDTITLTKLDQTYDLTLVPTWKNGVVGEFLAKDITWRSSQPDYVSVVGDTDKPFATVRVEKLPKELDQEMTITITAIYVNVLDVTKIAKATVKIKRMNNVDNKLQKILFNPTDVTLKTINDPVKLKLSWLWNDEIVIDGRVNGNVKDIDKDKSGADIKEENQKFQLFVDDLQFSSSNEEYVKVKKLDGTLKSNASVTGFDVYAEDQDVLEVTAVKLPDEIGGKVTVTLTATYLNKYGVEKKATANIDVRRLSSDAELKEIKVVPDSLLLTELGTTSELEVLPVWKNDIPGDFDKKNVSWSIIAPTDGSTYLKVDSSTGVVTVIKLPDAGADPKAVTVQAHYTDTSGKDLKSSCVVTIQNKGGLTTIKSITVTPNAKELTKVGDTLQLYVVGTYEGGKTEMLETGVAFSSNNEEYAKVSSSGLVTIVKTPAPNASDVTVIIKAQYGDPSDTCKITIPARKIYVDRLTGTQLCNTLVANLKYPFSSLFSYNTYLTETPPAGVTVNQNVTLTCIPSNALVIDNAKKTIEVMPITNETAVVKLVLTADNPSPNCKPLEFDMTIRKNVPLIGVYWDYKIGSSGKTLFNYYEKKNGIDKVAEYYYEETVGNNTTYKYHTDPDWARSVCTIKVTTSNPRVLKVDEKTKRLIPVGNGESELTITATTPDKSITKSDTIIVVVQNSPYNPITDLKIGYDEKTATNATYNSESNTLRINFNHGITLMPKGIVPTNAKLDQGDVWVTMEDGRKVKTVSATEVKWSSSNPEVASVNEKGEVKVNKCGSAVITLKVNDNGVEFVKTVNIKGYMTFWQFFAALIIAIITFNWGKVPQIFRDYFAGLF